MSQVRTLLVDDHTVVRRGLRRIFEMNPGIVVVGEANDAKEAIEQAHALMPDVVVMDIALPGMTGIEATRRIAHELPDIRVVMLSMYADAQYVEQSRAAGACGYLRKDADHEDVVAAVIAIAHGEQVFPTTSATRNGAPPEVLSLRERQVLGCIATGDNNREIADKLGISVNTVESHRKHIIEKLDLHSAADLVRYAIRHGLDG